VKSRRSLFLEVDSFHVNSLPNIRCHRSCRAIFHVDNRHTLAFLPLVRSILLRWNSGLVKVEALKTRYCQVRLARMMFDTLEIHGQLCYQNNTKRRERERERERERSGSHAGVQCTSRQPNQFISTFYSSHHCICLELKPRRHQIPIPKRKPEA
jgi:hypothetical protein